MEIQAVYLPGVVGEDRADGHAADGAVVQLRQRGRHLVLDRAAAAAARPHDFSIYCSGWWSGGLRRCGWGWWGLARRLGEEAEGL